MLKYIQIFILIIVGIFFMPIVLVSYKAIILSSPIIDTQLISAGIMAFIAIFLLFALLGTIDESEDSLRFPPKKR